MSAKRRVWVSEGRPRGMEFKPYREYKRAKRQFRNALNEEHQDYMRKVYSDIDKAAEIDVRLLWKLTKHRKPRRSRIYPEIRDEGVTQIHKVLRKRLLRFIGNYILR